MISENTFNKSKLISELKEIHIELVEVYKKIFDFKYRTNEDFEALIDKEYKENKISSGEQQVWNDNFCHRASYTLLNKILFIRICEDKGFMLNPEDYVAGEPKDPHIGKKLSRIGLQKWANLVTNYTLGELVKLAFLDMKKSYSSISLYKDDKYEMLTPTTEELSLKYLDGDEEAQKLVLQFENALSNIVEKLDTNNYNFNNTDGNILGDVYEKFMDRETRKAIGQFYTPEFVIEYILNNTVAKADVVENPFVSVADISCGSGHFLIMAYDILRERFINNLELLRDKYSNELYTIKKNGKEEELKGRDYWKEENIHYHLLKHCIYGADIDSFAVQLTTINLLLKDLDNFTDELNIVECDSLIKWEEDYDWIDLKQQLEEEFEIVEYNQINLLGEEEKTLVTRKKETYELTYKDIIGIEKTEKISKERAEEIVYLCEFWSKRYEYVVGNPPYIPITQMSETNKQYYRDKYQCSTGRTNTFSLFFERAINSRCSNTAFIVPSRILLNTQYTNIREYMLENSHIEIIADLSEGVFEDATVDTVIIILSNNNVTMESQLTKIEKIKNDGIESKEVNQELFLQFDNSYINIYVSAEEINLISKIKNSSIRLGDIADIRDGIIQGAVSNELFLGKRKMDSNKCKKVLYGENIRRYEINWNNEYIYYDKEYLTKLEDERTKGKGRGLRLREPVIFERNKILTRQTADRIIAAYDNEDIYYMNTLHGTHVIDKNFNELYVLALMNSNLVNFYYTRYNYEVGKTFAQVKIENLNNLPILKMDLEKQKYIADLCNSILDTKRVNESEIIIGETKEQLLKSFIESEKNNVHRLSNYNSYLILIDFYLYSQLELDKEEVELIESANRKLTKDKIFLINQIYPYETIDYSILEEVYKRNLKNVMEDIQVEKFIELHYVLGKSIAEIAEVYNYEYNTIVLLQQSYIRRYPENEIQFYNISSLFAKIKNTLRQKLLEVLKDDISINYYNSNKIKEIFYERVPNIDDLIDILRFKDSNKKSVDILKDIIDTDSCTWSAYRKTKKNNKNIKTTFIKHYDSNYYGLAEWSDEIHKNYFLDAIEEYTVNNPNEKKAKDILKLFKGLDIEDKQDYIEVIEEKIRKTFK
jgi:type I restriction-modification system DNA methylase subunit